jgi:hypothetical protein
MAGKRPWSWYPKYKGLLLQCNLGRSRRAQDLLFQTIRENEVALSVVAEPYRVLDSPNWVGDLDGTTAINWTTTTTTTTVAPGALLERGNGYVAIEWTGIAVVGVYVSPNCSLDEYEDSLDRIAGCLERRFRPRQILVLGDFNARSSQWGDTRTNTRGRMLADWAAGLGLLLANRGTTSTCVAWRGSSVVDVTWATAGLYRRIRNWRVDEGIETLSDHLYALMKLASEAARNGLDRSGTRGADRSRSPPSPRWRLKELDRDLLPAAVAVAAWSWDARATQESSIEEEAENPRKDMRARRLRVLVDGRNHGRARKMRSGPQRSPKGPPQADTRRRGDLPPLQGLQGEETRATAGPPSVATAERRRTRRSTPWSSAQPWRNHAASCVSPSARD